MCILLVWRPVEFVWIVNYQIVKWRLDCCGATQFVLLLSGVYLSLEYKKLAQIGKLSSADSRAMLSWSSRLLPWYWS